MDLTGMNKTNLLKKCKEMGITKCSSKTKAELIELIQPTKMVAPILHGTSPTFIEVCAGGGGLSSGLMKAGFTPLLLNDNNKDCCETLKKTHEGVNIKCCSMEDLDLSHYSMEDLYRFST
jgi:hypothetical protein